VDTFVRPARPIRALAWLTLAIFVVSPLLVPFMAQAATKTVRMVDGGFFEPQDQYARPNDGVRWRNDDPNNLHNVTFENGSFSRDVSTGTTSDTKVFPSQGTFRYYCSRHGAPGGVGMFGRVIVNSTGQPPPEPTGNPTATITLPATSTPKPPKKTPTASTSAKPSSTPSASATPSPTPSETPAPTPTETLPSSSALPTFASGETGTGDNNNLGAVAAIVVVAVLGGAGYLVYRRFIASP
jgi:LPXTG-motif cell wall-anchored protein